MDNPKRHLVSSINIMIPASLGLPKSPWSLKVDEIADQLSVDINEGLLHNEIHPRASHFGKNKIQELPKPSILIRYLSHFRDFLIYILLAGTFFALLAGEYVDAVVILLIVIGNGTISFLQEEKAQNDLAALEKISAPLCRVKREGQIKTIPSVDVVPGDIMCLEEGDAIAADLRLFDVIKLGLDESALTGESDLIEKQIHPLGEDISLAERNNMCFMGTTVLTGRGQGIVIAVGGTTELGKIAVELESVGEKKTPLQVQLEEFGKRLAVIALLLCALIFGLNWLYYKRPFVDSLLSAVALAIAAVPEGLPAVVTICLAIGIQKMRKRNAIVKNLPSVETLGAADYLCTDKTGTLTKGEMEAVDLFINGKLLKAHALKKDEIDSATSQLLEIAISCNNATETSGSPTEKALRRLAESVGLAPLGRIDENPFSSERKRMSTVHPSDSHFVVFIKGSAEAILEVSSRYYLNGERSITPEIKTQIEHEISRLARAGLRVLGFAEKRMNARPESVEEAESDLVFIGLIGLKDPLRPEVAAAVNRIQLAHIHPILITGDHPETAYSIAQDAGIIDPKTDISDAVITGRQLDSMTEKHFLGIVEKIRIYARVTPLHKLKIISALQQLHHVVGMTGDGVNDAPAVKKSDIGVSMGIRGTEVTKGASDLVLLDDNYHTIVGAIEEGRVIFRNIKLFTSYLLSCNFAEILIFVSAILVGVELPFNARLLLLLNLVTDFLPALALAYETESHSTMLKPPIPPGSPVIDRIMWINFAVQSIITAGVVMGIYLILYEDVVHAMTVAYVVMSLAETFRALTARSQRSSLRAIGIFRNKVSLLAIVTSTLVTLSLVFIPSLRAVFDTVLLSWRYIGIAFLLALIPPIAEEVTKYFIRQWKIEPYPKVAKIIPSD